MLKKTSNKKAIIINRIFSGSYLDENGNIGHEVINLFKADNNNYYVYLMPSGTYPLKRKNDDVQAIYITESVGNNRLKVLAIATGITPVFIPKNGFVCFDRNDLSKYSNILNPNTIKSIGANNLSSWLINSKFKKMNRFNRSHLSTLSSVANNLCALTKTAKTKSKNLMRAIIHRVAHIENLIYIIKNDVKYGGVRVDRIFDKNTTQKYGFTVYLTYKADRVFIPKNDIYLATDKNRIKNDIVLKRKRLTCTSLANYFEEGTDDYDTLYNNITPTIIESVSVKKYSDKSFDDMLNRLCGDKSKENLERLKRAINNKKN